MTFTLEVRWFGTPPLPDELRRWLDTLGAVETSTQNDLYLPAGDSALNVKLRDDELQIKRRLAGPFRRTFGPKATGRCEQWVKWRFGPEEEQPSLWEEDPTGVWVSVKKTRHQCTIDPKAQSSLTADLPTSPPASIEVELTTLDAESESAWTLCLEAEGPVQSLGDTLTIAAPLLLDDRLPVVLSSEESFGYVHWLQQVAEVSTRPAPENQIAQLD